MAVAAEDVTIIEGVKMESMGTYEVKATCHDEDAFDDDDSQEGCFQDCKGGLSEDEVEVEADAAFIGRERIESDTWQTASPHSLYEFPYHEASLRQNGFYLDSMQNGVATSQTWQQEIPMEDVDASGLLQQRRSSAMMFAHNAHSGASFDDLASQLHDESEDQTTVMMRDLPNNLTRVQLLELLEMETFPTSLLNLLYLPVDFKKQANPGYAFINFVSAQEALRFWQTFTGFKNWGLVLKKEGPLTTYKVCRVSWSETQGLQKNVDRYRNSPVMHKDVPDEYKPVLFCDGERIPFPAATKRIKLPSQLRNKE